MLAKTKILIVDDYPVNIQSLSELIASDKVEIYSALHADEALELLMKHEFALALLDVQMPEITGFELAKIIRSVAKLRNLPIIFVTAQNEDSALIFEGYKSGAVDLLFKPLIPDVVRAKVEMFVELSQQRELLQLQVKELQELQLEAKAANIAKSRFLVNMSHEIRTPLGAILGYSELIAKALDGKDPTITEFCSVVARNGKLLMGLIDNIFDLSKIETNKFELNYDQFNLKDLLSDIEATLAFKATEKGLSLSFSNLEDIACTYRSDPIRIKQILLNVIGNAIKFTEQGNIAVDVAVEPDPVQNFDRLKVKVIDQGIGLDRAQANLLFEPFAQADPSNKRRFGGVGLGLTISREIARAMNGDLILLDSKEGIGSTFLIELKLEKVALSTAKTKNLKRPIAAVDFSQKKVLCVDDAYDNLRLIDLILRNTGIDLTLVQDGFEAVEKVKDNEYDLILMDIQMPGMDGYEATRKIRDLGFEKPIIAVTAHALREEHEKCLQSGCDFILKKPLSHEALMSTLKEQLAQL